MKMRNHREFKISLFLRPPLSLLAQPSLTACGLHARLWAERERQRGREIERDLSPSRKLPGGKDAHRYHHPISLRSVGGLTS